MPTGFQTKLCSVFSRDGASPPLSTPSLNHTPYCMCPSSAFSLPFCRPPSHDVCIYLSLYLSVCLSVFRFCLGTKPLLPKKQNQNRSRTKTPPRRATERARRPARRGRPGRTLPRRRWPPPTPRTPASGGGWRSGTSSRSRGRWGSSSRSKIRPPKRRKRRRQRRRLRRRRRPRRRQPRAEVEARCPE